jgi:hypothetical protein
MTIKATDKGGFICNWPYCNRLSEIVIADSELRYCKGHASMVASYRERYLGVYKNNESMAKFPQ